MWALYTILGYFILVLITPIVWALGKAYRRASGRRTVFCPEDQERTFIELDAGYAVRMHALGNPEERIKACARWPDRQSCGQECLTQIRLAA